MPRVTQRIDKLPMHRGAGNGPLGNQAVLYTVRELDPEIHDELHRRAGTERQAQYGDAPAFAGPSDSRWMLDRQSLDIGGTAFTVAGRVKVGAIQEIGPSRTELWRLQDRADAYAETDTDMVRLNLLKDASGDYYFEVQVYDTAGTLQDTLQSSNKVEPGDKVNFAVYTTAALGSTPTLGLNLDGTTVTSSVPSATFNMSNCVFWICGGRTPEGDYTSVDPVNLFASDVSGTALATIASRDATGTLAQLQPDSVAPIGTGNNAVFPYPSPALIKSGKLETNGYSGCVRVPFNRSFEEFFASPLNSVAKKTWGCKLRLSPKFWSNVRQSKIVDFPGFFTLRMDASTNLHLTYAQESEWATTASITIGEESTLWFGCDGTNLRLTHVNQAGTRTTYNTALVEDLPPVLSYERQPDFIIASGEDPADKNWFHGSISECVLYDHFAADDNGEPIFELDLSRTEPADKSRYRMPVAAEPHTTVDALPVLVPGPTQDSSHAGVLGGQIFVGCGATAFDTYISSLDGSFTSAMTAARFGNRVIACEPGGTLVLADTDKSQVRPFGMPQVQADVAVRAFGPGQLDGAYSYGVRYISGDGTYGPIRRLKPVKATDNVGVLLGASGGGAGAENDTQLGESYGAVDADGVSYFSNAYDTSSNFTAGTDPEDGLTVETHISFPGFEGLEEEIFDRGASYGGSKESMWANSDSNISLDFTKDFTMQAAFSYDSSYNPSGTSDTDSQCILAIGHDDGDPWTRPFMLAIHKDSGGYGSGTGKIVAFRPTGTKGGKYAIGGIDHSSDDYGNALTLTNGRDYIVTAARKNDGLEIRVYDKQGDAWYHYTSGTPAGTSGWEDLSSFWDGDNNHGHNKSVRMQVRYFSPSHKEKGSSNASNAEEHGRLTNTGYSGTSGYWTGAISSASKLYHARSWSRHLSRAEIMFESLKRRAATPGGPLEKGIVSDVAFITDRVGSDFKTVWDRARGVPFNLYAENTTKGKRSNPKTATLDYYDGGASTVIHGTYITETGNSTLADCEYQLYASSIGEGAIIVSTSSESAALVTKEWKPGAPGVLRLESIANFTPSEFNWYTASVPFTDRSTEWDLSVRDFSINGIDTGIPPLAGPNTATLTKTAFVIYLGGFTGTTNSVSPEIGEFRMWNTNRYDDEDYGQWQFARVADKDDLNKLQFYATFQPSDENDPVDGFFDDRGTLATNNDWTKTSWTGGGDNDARIVDGREIVDNESDNPAPAIQFPDPPYPHITAIQLLRTAGVSIEDPEDDEEVSRALIAAEGLPLRELARINAGRNSYTDIIPDTGLGAEALEGTGFVPARVNGVFTWANRVGIFREGVLQLSEPGAFGWESFLPSNQITVGNTGTSDITAAVPFAGSLAVFGTDWCTVLTGQFEQYRENYLGGAGAQSARSVATYGGQLFALSDTTLWRITPPSGLSATEAVDFGAPVQDLLPAQGRLAISGTKSSLYVINETTGETLRFHFPTQRWFVEDRDALCIGDIDSGFAVTHTQGSYSLENTALTGDDVGASDTAETTATLSSPTSTISKAGLTVTAGTRLLVIDSAGSAVLTRVVSYSDPTLTVTTNSLSSLADGVAKLKFGVPEEGMLVDTGWFVSPTNEEMQTLKLNTGQISGTEFEVCFEGSPSPGSRSAASTTAYTELDANHTADQEIAGGSRGRWNRVRVRNRAAQTVKLDRVEITQDLEQ